MLPWEMRFKALSEPLWTSRVVDEQSTATRVPAERRSESIMWHK